MYRLVMFITIIGGVFFCFFVSGNPNLLTISSLTNPSLHALVLVVVSHFHLYHICSFKWKIIFIFIIIWFDAHMFCVVVDMLNVLLRVLCFSINLFVLPPPPSHSFLFSLLLLYYSYCALPSIIFVRIFVSNHPVFVFIVWQVFPIKINFI